MKAESDREYHLTLIDDMEYLSQKVLIQRIGKQMTAPKKRQNRVAIFALVGAGALAASVGGVFAANSIEINSGGTIEFGQGLAATSSCETALDTTLSQSYNITDGLFEATQIGISGIDDSGCSGKTIHVSLIGDSAVVCDVDGTGSNAFEVTSGLTTKTITIADGCDASTVKKIAITTS
jgi:hypothetical protein